jgi:hypothetical protein
MLALGVANLVHPTTTTLFPYAIGDNGLKRHRGLLKSPIQKHNHLNDKATKHLNCDPRVGLKFLLCNNLKFLL